MVRIAGVVVLVMMGCRRDNERWPQEELDSFEKSCPVNIGIPRSCHCFATEVAKRVPLSEAKRFVDPEASPAERRRAAGFAYEALSGCAKDATITPWPHRLRATFTATCVKDDLSDAACACLVEIAEKKVPPESWVAAGLAMEAGHPMPAEVQAIFKGPTVAECVSREMKWEPRHREQIVTGCKPSEPMPGFCECMVDLVMSEMTPAQMVALSLGRDDGGIEAHSADIGARCVERLTTKTKK